MPLGLGLALSHSQKLYRSKDQWEDIYQKLIGSVPQPNLASEETPEVLDRYAGQIEGGFQELRRRLEAYKPDAVIVLVNDQRRMFDETQVPQLHIYKGNDIWGSTTYTDLGEPGSSLVTIPCHDELGGWLADELTWEGFDMNLTRGKFTPQGDPEAGVGHTLTDPVLALLPRLDVPIVPFHINAHVSPAISGHRMPPLGRAMAKVLTERPERIALVASGGLSGDPKGYLAGWIDETLDRWILTRLQRSRSEQLQTLWDLDSDTVRGATGQVRNWIAVGSAMEAVGAKATVVDYIRFHHAAVGTAFAYWDPEERDRQVAPDGLLVVPDYRP